MQRVRAHPRFAAVDEIVDLEAFKDQSVGYRLKNLQCVNLGPYPGIRAWLGRVADEPGHIPITKG